MELYASTLETPATEDRLRTCISTIENYPKPGILFRDITSLLADAGAFREAVDRLVEPYRDAGIDKIAGIEARGLILGGAMAYRLGAGFAMIRKKGKLPRETVRVAYSLEYGMDEMEMHRDAVAAGERVLLTDDLVATGGTALAAADLVRQLGAEIAGASFVIDLPDLGGADRLRALGIEVRSLVAFDGH